MGQVSNGVGSGFLEYKPLMDFGLRAAEIEESLGDERLRQIYRKTISSVDIDKVKAFQEKYRSTLESVAPQSYEKYADLPFWIRNKVPSVAFLNLDKRSPLDILDIGTGAAHFPAICQALGHRVVGIDIDYPLYQDACGLFSVDRRSLGVYSEVPLKPLGRKFDLITAIAINFHYESNKRGYWSIDDWAFLVRDLIDNHLKTPGTIYFELNRRMDADGTEYFDQDLLNWAVAVGAVVNWPRGIITLSVPDVRTPVVVR